MSANPYSDLVRSSFANTRHGGDLDGATTVEMEAQGVRVRLAATHRDGLIQGLRFRAWGCPHVIAACETVCADYEGQPATKLNEFRIADIMRKLSVPVEKTGRILVIEDAVHSLGRSICTGSALQQS